MKLGIISDTHDHFDKAEEAADFLEEKNCEKVIHCGDMICPATADLFDREFDFYAVQGNNDGEWGLKDSVESFGEWMGNIGDLEFKGLEIAVYHGTDEELADGLVKSGKYEYVFRGHKHRKKVREADGLVKSGKYEYVFRGHKHRKKVREADGTVEINPGGVKLPFQEEKIHVVVFDLESEEFEFHRIEV
jgi:putative phosphoesterase